MLIVEIEPIELFDEITQKFINTKSVTLELEHSLVSISKWEAITHKSFLSSSNLTTDDILLYIRCMTINHRNVDPIIFENLPSSVYQKIKDYIDDPYTATVINHTGSKKTREIITSEIIYYWMITFNIPIKFEQWHINRLLTLIDVVSIKNQKPKKMSRLETAAYNTALNEKRLKEFGG